jgi:hypothetical protein
MPIVPEFQQSFLKAYLYTSVQDNTTQYEQIAGSTWLSPQEPTLIYKTMH